MASGSQVYSGICADLPAHPRKKKRVMAVMRPELTSCGLAAAHAVTPPNSRVPAAFQSMNMAIRNPTSPIRFTMNAFFPASALAFSVNQNPIRR